MCNLGTKLCSPQGDTLYAEVRFKVLERVHVEYRGVEKCSCEGWGLLVEESRGMFVQPRHNIMLNVVRRASDTNSTRRMKCMNIPSTHIPNAPALTFLTPLPLHSLSYPKNRQVPKMSTIWRRISTTPCNASSDEAPTMKFHPYKTCNTSLHRSLDPWYHQAS